MFRKVSRRATAGETVLHRVIRGWLVAAVIVSALLTTVGLTEARPPPPPPMPGHVLTGKTAAGIAAELDVIVPPLFKEAGEDAVSAMPYLIQRLAATVITDAHGKPRLSPEVWQSAVAAMLRLSDLRHAAAAADVPGEYARYLIEWSARRTVRNGFECDFDGLIVMLHALPAGCEVVRLQAAGLTEKSFAQLDPVFLNRAPFVRKLLMDHFTHLHPWLEADGFLIAESTVPGSLQIAVPASGSEQQFFFYRMTDADAPFLRLPAPALEQAASAKAILDLRLVATPPDRLPDGLSPQIIDLSGAGLADISAITRWSGTRELLLADTVVADISPLKGMALHKLNLANTPVTRLAPLQGMPLRELTLAGTLVTDLTTLKDMPLTFLDLRDVPDISLAPLAGSRIETLLLSPHIYRDMDTLERMPALKSVSDYTPDAWMHLLTNAPASAGSSGGRTTDNTHLTHGGTVTLRFKGQPSGMLCDFMTVTMVFDRSGTLASAKVIAPPNLNVPHHFAPHKLILTKQRLRIKTALAIAASEPWRSYTLELPDATVTGTQIAGDFTFSFYERHRRLPGDLRTVTGTVSGTISTDLAIDAPAAERLARDWPDWRGPLFNGSAPLEADAALTDPSSARLVWTQGGGLPAARATGVLPVVPRAISAVSGGYAAPILHQGRLYMHYYTPSGMVFDRRMTQAHVAENGFGREKWMIEADDVITGYDAQTGQQIWKRVFARGGLNLNAWNTAGARPLLTPTAYDGMLYAAGTAGRVYAIEAKTGALRWTAQGGPHAAALEHLRHRALREEQMPLLSGSWSSPLVFENVLVCSDHSGFTVASARRTVGLTGLDRRTGRTLWRLENVCRNDAVPVRFNAAGREYVLTATENSVHAIDPIKGTVAWTINSMTYSSAPGIDGDILVCESPDGGLVGLQIAGGTPRTLWSQPAVKRIGGIAPVTAGGYVFMAGNNQIIAVKSASGALTFFEANGISPWVSALAAAGRFVIAEGMRIYEVTPEGPVETATGWNPGHESGVVPVIADGLLFLRSRSGLMCYDFKTAVTASDKENGRQVAATAPENTEMLISMLVTGSSQVRNQAARVLCQTSGDAGRTAVVNQLVSVYESGEAGVMRPILASVLHSEFLSEMMPLLSPLLLRLLADDRPDFFKMGSEHILSAADDAKKAGAELILLRLQQDNHAMWDAAVDSYVRLTGTLKGQAVAANLLVPRLHSENRNIRQTALNNVMRYAGAIKRTDREAREQLAAGLFAAWRLNNYADPNGFLVAQLGSLGADAKALVPALVELTYDRRIGRQAHTLLDRIAPEAAKEIGPSLEDALDADLNVPGGALEFDL